MFLILGISVIEMEHLERLGKAMVCFGVDPVFAGKYNYFSCDYANYSKNVRGFLISNVQGEIGAKNEYLKLAGKTENKSLCELLTRIAMDEELHM